MKPFQKSFKRKPLNGTLEHSWGTSNNVRKNQPFNEKLPITASDRASAGPWPNNTYGLLFKIFQIHAFVSKAHIIERQY